MVCVAHDFTGHEFMFQINTNDVGNIFGVFEQTQRSNQVQCIVLFDAWDFLEFLNDDK